MQLSLDNERRSLVAAEEVARVMADAVSDDQIAALYAERFAEGTAGKEYNASHILVETEAEAQAIVDELAAGADFAALAQTKSTGPSGPAGGELGWFGPGRMVPDFEAAVIALGVGQVSGPVQTQFGWHVIRLNDTRKVEAPMLDEVREDLALEIQRETVRAHIDALTAAAVVDKPDLGDLDPSVITAFDLLRN